MSECRRAVRPVADRNGGTSVLPELLGGSDRAGVARAMQAMMQMVKLDIAGLRKAYDGGQNP
jgi:hypothetical protein